MLGDEEMKILKNWLLSFLIAFLVFYSMNHIIMSLQNLPLNVDMTPAQ